LGGRERFLIKTSDFLLQKIELALGQNGDHLAEYPILLLATDGLFFWKSTINERKKTKGKIKDLPWLERRLTKEYRWGGRIS
jgi:hypothetical protein